MKKDWEGLENLTRNDILFYFVAGDVLVAFLIQMDL